MENQPNNLPADNKSEFDVQPDVNRQNKIIGYCYTKDPNILGYDEYPIDMATRQNFFESVNEGIYGDKEFSELLNQIKSPIHSNENNINNPINTFSAIANENQQLGIIAALIRGNFNERGNLSPVDLGNFFRRYPNPIELQQDANNFMEMISKVNGQQKADEYKRSFNKLQKTVYGKRYDYFNQIEILKSEAGKIDPRKYYQPEINQPGEEFNEFQEIEPLVGLSQPEMDRLVNKIKIRGDKYKGEQIGLDDIIKEGLYPKYKVEMGNKVTCMLSDVYELDEGRSAVFGYVLKDGKYSLNSYYKSRSQGVWRYMSDYGIYDNGNIARIGKGGGNLYSESSVELPIVLQKSLAAISERGLVKTKKDPFRMLTANSEVIFSKDKVMPKFYKEINPNCLKIEQNLSKTISRMEPPERVTLDSSKSPDFNNLVDSWRQNMGIYGHVKVDIFDSNDKLLKYMFCKDRFNRVWIPHIELNNSKIQSCGLKENWVGAFNLMTPASEYYRQTGSDGYGGSRIDNDYVDMYEKYLSKIPVIEQYVQLNLERADDTRSL